MQRKEENKNQVEKLFEKLKSDAFGTFDSSDAVLDMYNAIFAQFGCAACDRLATCQLCIEETAEIGKYFIICPKGKEQEGKNNG